MTASAQRSWRSPCQDRRDCSRSCPFEETRLFQASPSMATYVRPPTRDLPPPLVLLPSQNRRSLACVSSCRSFFRTTFLSLLDGACITKEVPDTSLVVQITFHLTVEPSQCLSNKYCHRLSSYPRPCLPERTTATVAAAAAAASIAQAQVAMAQGLGPVAMAPAQAQTVATARDLEAAATATKVTSPPAPWTVVWEAKEAWEIATAPPTVKTHKSRRYLSPRL